MCLQGVGSTGAVLCKVDHSRYTIHFLPSVRRVLLILWAVASLECDQFFSTDSQAVVSILPHGQLPQSEAFHNEMLQSTSDISETRA